VFGNRNKYAKTAQRQSSQRIPRGRSAARRSLRRRSCFHGQ